jgi:hypothetical protein
MAVKNGMARWHVIGECDHVPSRQVSDVNDSIAAVWIQMAPHCGSCISCVPVESSWSMESAPPNGGTNCFVHPGRDTPSYPNKEICYKLIFFLIGRQAPVSHVLRATSLVETEPQDAPRACHGTGNSKACACVNIAKMKRTITHVLVQAGLEVGGIMGTSAGALSGSLYAAGLSPAQARSSLRHRVAAKSDDTHLMVFLRSRADYGTGQTSSDLLP